MGMDFSKVFSALRSTDSNKFTDSEPGSSMLGGVDGSFVYGLLSQWYWVIVGPALYVTYKVLKTLQEKGILDAILNNIKASLNMLQKIADNCPQYIDDLDKFFQCLALYN